MSTSAQPHSPSETYTLQLGYRNWAGTALRARVLAERLGKVVETPVCNSIHLYPPIHLHPPDYFQGDMEMRPRSVSTNAEGAKAISFAPNMGLAPSLLLCFFKPTPPHPSSSPHQRRQDRLNFVEGRPVAHLELCSLCKASTRCVITVFLDITLGAHHRSGRIPADAKPYAVRVIRMSSRTESEDILVCPGMV